MKTQEASDQEDFTDKILEDLKFEDKEEFIPYHH